MNKPITPRAHGILDYAIVAIFLNAPMVLGFSGAPASALYWLAGILVLITGITAIPYGMFKVIPFRIHRVIDVAVGSFLIVSPWLFAFSSSASARNFFVVVGLLTFAIVGLTDYTPRPEEPPREPGDRRRWRAPPSTD